MALDFKGLSGAGGPEGASTKSALVTGSSNGIGEAIAKHLARLNFKLAITGRDGADLGRVGRLCAQLSPSKFKPLEVIADLGEESGVERLFELSSAHFGRKMNLLVNNAGCGPPVGHERTQECLSNYKRTLQVNLNAPVQLTLLSIPLLLAGAAASREASSVINVGSIAADRPSQALFAYSTSKAALKMFSASMAVELAPNIRVNCVQPGPIETKIFERGGFSHEIIKRVSAGLAPLGRVGQPEEVAQAVAFLADSRRASYITGADLNVDGGTSLAPMRWQP